MMEVFDRYAAFVDLVPLKDFSARPLRKSIRVNTLKTTVEKFTEWARERDWKIEPVLWCPEGFFIDRPALASGELRPTSRFDADEKAPKREALGKDLLHLMGHIYMQEAASMLPPVLLDPQPGDAVLDMAAAPGSKTTQVAACLAPSPYPLPPTHLPAGRGSSGTARGVVVANDVQEKRLWTLKSAIHRLGVTNVIITKKVGQWFGKHMTERFDRVLCDAPCTAQGTVRKDSDALNFCGPENIGKMARLQEELLEAAIHATKVGGRIVYSTCTLTPEENEGVVISMLRKFEGKLEVFDPREKGVGGRAWGVEKAIEDSFLIQKFLHPTPDALHPFLRLWPQTYDTEGFFCAVLTKTATTRPVERMEWRDPQESLLKKSVQDEIIGQLDERYGTRLVLAGETLAQRENQILLTTEDVMNFNMPVQDYSIGLPFGKGVKEGRVRLTSEFVALRGAMATKNKLSISDTELQELFEGRDIECREDLHGDVILLWRDIPIGWGLAQEGWLKNRLSRWVVGHKTG